MNRLTSLLTLQGIYFEKDKLLLNIGLQKLTKYLKSKHISPNLISSLNVLVAFGALFSLFSNQLLFAILMTANTLIDGFDGYYARTERLNTKFGDWIDHGGDFIFGLLFLYKSYYVLDFSWVIPLIFLYVAEMLLIYKMRLWKDKFPNRIFLIFYIFGWYREGLVAQGFIQISSMSLTLTKIFSTNKKEII